MSVELKKIKRRINTTNQLHKVTSALQKVASARMYKFIKDIDSRRNVLNKLLEVMALAAHEIDIESLDHPFLKKNIATKQALIVLGSDKGLCGAYNTQLAEYAAKFTDENTDVITSGKIMVRKLKRLNIIPLIVFEQPSANNTNFYGKKIFDWIYSEFKAEKYSKIEIIYSKYENPVRQDIVKKSILPVDKDYFKDLNYDHIAAERFIFEPSAESIFLTLLPNLAKEIYVDAVINSFASENASRMAAMARANENSSEMLDDMGKRYSSLRQQNITTEMLEIISGMRN
ncbi:MAG: F0F1 ATP synthase subunit gamma [Kiritimatiellae bacterium]|jgi:F-type H+-transporting ATPase subunit gamma|nr:F0F1 ATP synthase subunit gamma [Kiritimatiellia bacterium]